MFGTYLMRELTNRKKHTAIIAIGMALAIALVIIVNGVAAGVRDAQSSVLASVYGVGTDITVSQTPVAPTGDGAGQRPSFDFGAADGQTTDGSTSLSQSRLAVDRDTTTFDSTTLETVLAVDNVSAGTATLSLSNTSFNGQIPDITQTQEGTAAAGPTDGGAPRGGGPDGGGGSSFDVDSFTVEGIDVAGVAVGPLTSATLTDGRTFESTDSAASVVVVDSAYATTAGVAVGDTLAIGGTDFEVIGLVTSGTSDAATASNTYIPLGVAQAVSGLDGQVSSIYVQASSSEAITQVQSDIETALPDATVQTQADLASSVSGSLSTASTLVAGLGTWLSILVLAAAFLIAVLFTISGVTRRTREFGTLKAIGWSNRRIVGQVAGESVVQGAIGGAVGVAVGLIGLLAVNLAAPTLSAGTTADAASAAGFGGRGGGGGPAAATQVAATTDIVLQAPVTVPIILIAVGLALLGGIIAGVFGGWRAARLRPAEALRSIS
ncbi:ABC transporter permease [Salinibacterium sp. G-O1]|uniref:ABC transporter permease n=1 Tax=Salinibacterium sp. G-O1 TaxID=3046208 RepID=UPI0024BA9E4D|nr:ABC transporter permease [Salinibacterium sp. G-O1]MDJ0334305.1 ABC transporter permease [Salinibacterium sp. G-O1]